MLSWMLGAAASLHPAFVAVAVMVTIGVSAAVAKKNLVKIVMGINIMGAGINLFLISLGYRDGGAAPIFTGAQALEMVLPTPQALTLTSIVVDMSVTALMLSFAILIYRHYGSLRSDRRRLAG